MKSKKRIIVFGEDINKPGATDNYVIQSIQKDKDYELFINDYLQEADIGYVIRGEHVDIDRIRKNCKFVILDYWESPTHFWFHRVLGKVDLYITSTQAAKRVFEKDYDVRVIHLPQAAEATIFKPWPEKMKKQIDVLFIGTATMERERWIHAIEDLGINLQVYGNGWKYRKPIYREELVKKIAQTKICLCLPTRTAPSVNENPEKDNCYSIREFIYGASGGYILMPYNEDFISFMENIEPIGYKFLWYDKESIEDMVKMVKEILADDIEREIAIAKMQPKFAKITWEWRWEAIKNEIKKEDISNR